MKLIFISLFLSFVQYVYSVNKTECPIFSCSTSIPSSNTGPCFQATSNNHTLSLNYNQCPSGYACLAAAVYIPGLTPTTLDCQIENVQTGNNYPGQTCKQNKDCHSSTCTNGICIGGQKSAKCTQDIDCDIGFTCMNSNCVSQVNIGGSCQTEFNCINTATCNNANCVAYNSLADGTLVSAGNACKSGMIYINSSLQKVCDTLKVTKQECGDGQDGCEYTYSYSGKTFNQQCVCVDFATDQSRYCRPPTVLNITHVTGVHTDLRGSIDYSSSLSVPDCYGKSIFGVDRWDTINNHSFRIILTVFNYLLLIFLIESF